MGMRREELRAALGFSGGPSAFSLLLERWAERLPLFPAADRVRADEPELSIGEDARAGRVRAAVERVMRDGPFTPDLGGSATTAQITEAVGRGIMNHES